MIILPYLNSGLYSKGICLADNEGSGTPSFERVLSLGGIESLTSFAEWSESLKRITITKSGTYRVRINFVGKFNGYFSFNGTKDFGIKFCLSGTPFASFSGNRASITNNDFSSSLLVAHDSYLKIGQLPYRTGGDTASIQFNCRMGKLFVAVVNKGDYIDFRTFGSSGSGGNTMSLGMDGVVEIEKLA